MNFKGISFLKLNYSPKRIEKSSRDFQLKIEGELNFVVNFFFQMNLKGISYVK